MQNEPRPLKADTCARKLWYPSEQAARATKFAHMTPPPIVYRCEVCHGWHLAGAKKPDLGRQIASS